MTKTAEVKARPDWLIGRLRKQLQLEYELPEGYPSKKLTTWIGFAELIAEHTRVKIDDDRLRKFVKGDVRRGSAERFFPVPDPARIEAIIATITDPKDPWITLDVLERPEYDSQPPACLLDHLTDPVLVPRTDKLAGRFSALIGEDLVFEEIRLHLSEFDPRGMVHVREEQAGLRPSTASQYRAMHPRQQATQRGVRSTATGWGVITAEDQLIVMMRDAKKGIGHRWVLVGSVDLWTDEPVDRLVMLRQDSPFDIQFGEGVAPAAGQVQEQIAASVLTFERTGEPDER